MSHPEEVDNANDCEFKWGKMIDHGRTRKDVQYYESFTYDGVEYSLYDCVYLYVEDEPDPYIGKLVKIWDHPNCKKRVKVVWFFRPLEITNWLEDIVPLENEIFLASGEGEGLCNINPVEVLVGKCNVVCISQDKRNPQLSEEQVKMADHIFYRTFDVGKFTFSDKLENQIAGIEVKYFFNRKEYPMLIRDPEPKGAKLKKPKASAIEKNGVRAPISQAEHNAKLKTVKDLYNAGSSKNSSFEHFKFGDSAKRSRLQELNISSPSEVEKVSSAPPTVQKPRVCINDVGKSCASHVRTSEREGKMGVSHVRTSEHEGKVRGSHVTTSEREGKVGSAKGLVGWKRLSSCKEGFSKKETTINHKGTPELAQEKGAKNSKYIKIKEPVKDVQHDGGISRTMDLSKKTTKLSDKKAPELARKNGAGIDTQYLKAKEPNRIEKRMKEPVKDLVGLNRRISNTVNLSKKATKLSNNKAPEPAQEKGNKTDSHTFGVNQKPEVDRSKWFKQLPWEEKLDNAYQRGSLVLLQNFDPSYTSAEIEGIAFLVLPHASSKDFTSHRSPSSKSGIIQSEFDEKCTAKVLQQNTFSSPHSGQAFVIFKSKEKAEMVMVKLQKRCLMLPNGRPLIAEKGTPRVVPEKPSKFIGHLTIDKINLQKQREQNNAVSTSHFAQGNTIEYDMALEWIVLQKQWETTWDALFKQHEEELANLRKR